MTLLTAAVGAPDTARRLETSDAPRTHVSVVSANASSTYSPPVDLLICLMKSVVPVIGSSSTRCQLVALTSVPSSFLKKAFGVAGLFVPMPFGFKAVIFMSPNA